MARLARAVVPGVPHHVTQRGNRRQRTFFRDVDYESYLRLLSEFRSRCGVEVWAYCLMPNHVHLIVVPESPESLARALGETHRRYTRMINDREEWRGYLWQGRFASCPMENKHVLACARYIEMNPVRAKLVRRPEDWRWSSARFHLRGGEDPLTGPSKLTATVGDWRAFLKEAEADPETFRLHERTGRPLGGEAFLKRCERILDRTLRPLKPGRKKKDS